MGIGTACRLVTQLRSLERVLDFLCRDKKWSSRFPAVSNAQKFQLLTFNSCEFPHMLAHPKPSTRAIVGTPQLLAV